MVFTANGQLIAAVVTLIDAIFGILVVLGKVSVRPDQSIIALFVTGIFNLAGYVWAFIQHQQHVTQLRLAAQFPMEATKYPRARRVR